MIIILEDQIFLPRHTLRLQSLLQLGLEGWHRVQTDPPFEPAADRDVNRWLALQDTHSQEEIALTFAIGLEDDVLEIPSEISLRIGEVPAPDWACRPPRLPIETALNLLRRPLRLLVENHLNDGAFLRTAAPTPWRGKLLEAIARGWIELSHGGGSDMRPQIERVGREEAMRLWALFDSDAREPEQPSSASEALRLACLRKEVSHHRLRRRAIENYLPIKALEAWAHTSPVKQRAARRRAAAAFASMVPEHRHHYNMKAGFAGDRPNGIPVSYGSLAEHPDLQQGFGERITSLFHQEGFQIQEEWLARDGQQPEMIEMVQSIFRRL